MKTVSAVLLFLSFACLWLVLQACTLLTAPITSALIGGAQLALRGAELQKEIRKADAQGAIDTPFEETWDVSIIALGDLDIEITRVERNREEDGVLIEGLVKKTKIRVAVVMLTERITEIGIWANHDKALAGLIAEKIKEEAQKQDN